MRKSGTAWACSATRRRSTAAAAARPAAGQDISGRIGIYEIYRPTTSIRKLINDRASESDLRFAARQAGMVPLREDAIAKIKAGITSPDEVLRVVQVDENEVPCPGCKALIEVDFASCPYCRRSLKTSCAGCGQPLRLEWKLCPYCNTNALVQPDAEGLDALRAPTPQADSLMASAPMLDEAQFAPRPQPHVDEDEGAAPLFNLPEDPLREQYIGVDLGKTAQKAAPIPVPPAAARCRRLRRSQLRLRRSRRRRRSSPRPLRRPRRPHGPPRLRQPRLQCARRWSIRSPAAGRSACWWLTMTPTSGWW